MPIKSNFHAGQYWSCPQLQRGLKAKVRDKLKIATKDKLQEALKVLGE